MTTPAMDEGCACVVLAAGASRRLGRPKQLLRISGESLIHRTASLARKAKFAPVCVVLGSEVEQSRKELADCDVMMVENREWRDGMSTSLRAGIHHLLEQRPAMRHLLVLVCDQPGLSEEILEDLYSASLEHPERIIASAYSGRFGVPAIFPAAFFSNLLSIRGDKGARAVLDEFSNQVMGVDFPEGAHDIDTEADVRRAGLT